MAIAKARGERGIPVLVDIARGEGRPAGEDHDNTEKEQSHLPKVASMAAIVAAREAAEVGNKA